MISLPLTEAMKQIAARIIWFEPAERALADPARFLAYAMRYATHEDMKAIRAHVSDEEFRRAIDAAPPGIVDPRSWAYWNLMLGRYPAPPMPVRVIPDAGKNSVIPGPPQAEPGTQERQPRWLPLGSGSRSARPE